uniref:Cilia- and flagella-associated protein 91 n=1 Tax=Albugo laibachii Nc14 TaxID=890382 RepID=F0W171_9STRA|nr:hypothetical protein LOC100151718 [Albugo laibachii Nc14]|eukprot:CCA14796.1 hypothetical protein LOC100151718 [Albugo laibachii Nc14]
MQPSRPLDVVYDPLYTTSTSHNKYEGHKRRVVPNKRPISIKNNSGLVSGPERHKYFCRPVLPHLQAETPEVLYASAHDAANIMSISEDLSASTRSIGMQTMYRDSHAQTDPFSPEYVLPEGAVAPEIESLTNLRYRKGLPVTQAEIRMIEHNRKKKALKKVLPPMSDEASLNLRKRMMEAQEIMDLKFRENEIDEAHARRIEALQESLAEREKQSQAINSERMRRLEKTLMLEKEDANRRNQHDRIKELRKLANKRQRIQTILNQGSKKRDLIEEYADYASPVYAPQMRNGNLVRKSPVPEVQFKDHQLMTLDSIRELEKNLPPQIRTSPKNQFLKRAPLMKKSRDQMTMETHLLNVESAINKQHVQGEEKLPSSPYKGQYRAILQRPSTPNYAPQIAEAGSEVNALRLLQRLIRGRAVQNMMYEGKDRRAELIAELRESEEARRFLSSSFQVPAEETEITKSAFSHVEGEVVSELLDVLQKELIRNKEIAKVYDFAQKAAEDRHQREIEEGARRQLEDLARDRHDQIYCFVTDIHRSTANDYIDSIFEDAVEDLTYRDSVVQSIIMTKVIDPILNILEEENSEDTIVKDLVSSFLFPWVQKHHTQDQALLEKRKYTSAIQALLAKVSQSMRI